jgi:hypothetical protein
VDVHGALAAALTLLGCQAASEPCVLGLPHLVVVGTDYQSGILTAADPASGTRCDPIAPVGPDPAVRSWGDEVAVFDRTGGSALRLFQPGVYERPQAELPLEPGLNVHDVVGVDGELWLAPYEGTEVLRVSRAGVALGAIDLADHADGDGLPEIDRFVSRGDRLYVGLQRLDRTEDWQGSSGRVVELDGADAGAWWATGPNPKLYPHPADDRRVVALTGTFFSADGALEVLDPDEGVTTTLVSEQALGYDLSGFAGVGGHAVVLGVDFTVGGPSHVDCVDLATGAVTPGLVDDAWFVDAVAAGEVVYVASRTGWAGEVSDRIWAVEPDTCAATVLAEGFVLDPFGIAWVEG